MDNIIIENNFNKLLCREKLGCKYLGRVRFGINNFKPEIMYLQYSTI